MWQAKETHVDDRPRWDIPDDALAHLRSAGRVMALSGAGISAESGLSTFRDPQTGYWSTFNPEDLASRRGFERNPGRVWSWYAVRRQAAARAQPNPGHQALAALQDYYPEMVVVTQNVDGLHQKACSRDVIELHGNIQRILCFEEHTPVDYRDQAELTAEQLAAVERGEWLSVPLCPRCGSLLRPDVVWFGEALPRAALLRADATAASCDVCFVVGTSAIVYPAAGLPETAHRAGALVVEVNPEETELTPHADISLRGKAGEVLPYLAALIRQAEA
jgi:NAD-dependent deacetylase